MAHFWGKRYFWPKVALVILCILALAFIISNGYNPAFAAVPVLLLILGFTWFHFESNRKREERTEELLRSLKGTLGCAMSKKEGFSYDILHEWGRFGLSGEYRQVRFRIEDIGLRVGRYDHRNTFRISVETKELFSARIEWYKLTTKILNMPLRLMNGERTERYWEFLLTSKETEKAKEFCDRNQDELAEVMELSLGSIWLKDDWLSVYAGSDEKPPDFIQVLNAMSLIARKERDKEVV